MFRGLSLVAPAILVFSRLAVAAPLGDEIKLLERRIRDRPHDFVAMTRLGESWAMEARQSGNLARYANATAAFEAALAEFSDHAPALLGLGSVYMALHRFASARELAEKVLRLAPTNVDAQLLLGDAQLAIGDGDAARKIFARLPESAPLFARRAELARLEGATDEAIRFCLRAADESQARGEVPENIAWYHVRAGELFFRTGNFNQAEREYGVARAKSPDAYVVIEHIAELLGAQEKFTEAAALYENLIARSHRPDLEQALGDLSGFSRKSAQAGQHYDAALSGYLASIGRGEVHFIHHIAGFYCDAVENGSEAVKYARRDLEIRHTPAAHEALAWALYKSGEPAEAQNEIDLALRSGIRDAHIFYHAALIYSSAGDLLRGKQMLREAAAVNPHYNAFHVHR